MIEVLLGCLAGVVTGLIPGLHLNTFMPLLSNVNIVGFVIGVAVANSFFDFIPAMFLGVPDESTALSVLPAHRLVLQGEGLSAFRLTILGGIYSSLIVIIMLPALLLFTEYYLFFKPLIPVILTGLLLLMLFSSRDKLLTLTVLVFSSTLGFLLLNEFILPSNVMLLPLFGGFFGVSTVLFSLFSRPFVPKQKLESSASAEPRSYFFGALGGIFSGLMPGISSSIAGLAAKKFAGFDVKQFLVVLGGTNTVYALMAVLAIFFIGNPRSGAGILIMPFADSALQITGLFLFALGISALLAMFSARFFVAIFNHINLLWLNLFSLAFVTGLTFIFAGPVGMLVLFTATCVGLVCAFGGVRRSTCMACLLFPVILSYL